LVFIQYVFVSASVSCLRFDFFPIPFGFRSFSFAVSFLVLFCSFLFVFHLSSVSDGFRIRFRVFGFRPCSGSILLRYRIPSISSPFLFYLVSFPSRSVPVPSRLHSVPFPLRCVPCPFRFRSAIFCFRSLSFCFYFPFLSFPIVFHFLFRLNVDWRSFGFSFAVPFLFPFCSPLVFLLLFASVLFFRFYSVTAFFSIGFGFGSDRFYSASQFHSISVSDYFYFLSVRFLFRFVSVPSRVLSVPFPFNFYSVSLFHFYSVRLGFVTLG